MKAITTGTDMNWWSNTTTIRWESRFSPGHKSKVLWNGAVTVSGLAVAWVGPSNKFLADCSVCTYDSSSQWRVRGLDSIPFGNDLCGYLLSRESQGGRPTMQGSNFRSEAAAWNLTWSGIDESVMRFLNGIPFRGCIGGGRRVPGGKEDFRWSAGTSRYCPEHGEIAGLWKGWDLIFVISRFNILLK